MGSETFKSSPTFISSNTKPLFRTEFQGTLSKSKPSAKRKQAHLPFLFTFPVPLNCISCVLQAVCFVLFLSLKDSSSAMFSSCIKVGQGFPVLSLSSDASGKWSDSQFYDLRPQGTSGCGVSSHRVQKEGNLAPRRGGTGSSIPRLPCRAGSLILSGGAAPHGITSQIQDTSSAIHCPSKEYHKGHSTLGDACFRSRIQSLRDW